MQEVARRTAREIFGSTVKVYLRPEFIRHLGLGDTKADFNNWIKMYQRQTASEQRGKIKVVETLGVSETFNHSSSWEDILTALADANLHDGREDLLGAEMKTYIAGHFDDWKSENGELFKSISGKYPSGQTVVNNLPETIQVPNLLVGEETLLSKNELGADRKPVERFYRVKSVSLANINDPSKKDVWYSVKHQIKLSGVYVDNPNAMPESVIASAMDAYKAHDARPFALSQKTKSPVLGR